MNNCKWLMIGSTTPCNKSCRNEYCGYHLQSVRNGSNGPTPCILCGVGVKGRSELCKNCGGKKYRELKRYYDKRIAEGKSNIESLVIKTPQDYINRFIIKANNKLDK
jgi:hypothetical protein